MGFGSIIRRWRVALNMSFVFHDGRRFHGSSIVVVGIIATPSRPFISMRCIDTPRHSQPSQPGR